MKLSLKWLQDYVDIKNIDAKEIANKLTMSGSKVETIEKDGYKISKIVVGKVLSIKKHENAEKLVVCEVLIGNDEKVQIVTGAQNVVEGALVPVCLNGATLFDGTVIKNQKLRGVSSQGMMCSLGELGLKKENFPYAIEDGIFLIEEDCEIGQDIKSAISLDDTILDFEITSNRPDCLSVYGLARETSATFSLPLKKISTEKFSNLNLEESKISVSINTDKCKRYMAILVEDVEIKPSPLYIRNRLRVNGVKPINNIVDITNYILLELGIPMHAYDASKVKNLKINVRTAKPNEKIKTLDNYEYTLNEENILICDDEKALSIAGVIGGVDSSVTKNTKNIIFEVACFEGGSIRKTSKTFNIKTESAIRFEKGLNPKCCEESLKRACELILELNAGKFKTKIVDIKNFEEKKEEVELNPSFINNFLGTNIEEKEMEKILNSLGFLVENKKVLVPPFRIDIKNKADIAEEIARIYGYDKIKPQEVTATSEKIGLTKEQKLENLVKQTASSLGLFEIYTFSFISPKLYEKMEILNEDILENSIKILNPFGEDTSLMRQFLEPSMLKTLSYNFRNKNEEAYLFEIGKTYKKENEEIKEEKNISIGLYGKDCDFYTLKGIIESILNSAGIQDLTFEKAEEKIFNPYACCKILINKKVLGYFGEVKPTICENFKIYKKTYIANLNWKVLYENANKNIKYKPISKFPALTRDLSFVCNDSISCGEIETEIKKNIGNILEKIEVFDIYKGDKIEKNKKSISFKIIMRNQEKTLKDKDVDKKIEKTLKNLEKIDVVLRQV